MVIGALFATLFIGATIFLTNRGKKVKNNEDKGNDTFQYSYTV